MSDFTVHTIATAPPQSAELLSAAKRKFGFVPNLLGELAAAPPALEAYLTLNDLLARTSLTPVEQQVVLVATSVANECDYCVAAHSAVLKMVGFSDANLRALREEGRLADEKLEALRVFVTTVTMRRGAIRQSDLRAFLDAGYSREQVLEVLVGVAMKTVSNYTNHIADTPLDVQFEPFAWARAVS